MSSPLSERLDLPLDRGDRLTLLALETDDDREVDADVVVVALGAERLRVLLDVADHGQRKGQLLRRMLEDRRQRESAPHCRVSAS
jgi:hypothetical protein